MNHTNLPTHAATHATRGMNVAGLYARRNATGWALLLAVFISAAIIPLNVRADETGSRVMIVSTGEGPAVDPAALSAALARSEAITGVLMARSEQTMLQQAVRSFCSLVIRVDSRVLASGSTVSSWRILNPVDGQTVEEGIIEGRTPRPRDLAEFWWLPLVGATEKALASVESNLVRVEAFPATIVHGLGDEVVVIPDSGYVELPLGIPGTFRWHSVSTGAYPESGTFSAVERGATLVIPRRPLGKLSVEAGLYMGQFPGLWAQWSLREDMIFARAGFEQFLAGYYLTDARYDDPSPEIVSSIPLVQIGGGAGAYFAPVDARVRPYGAITGQIRLLMATWSGVRIDPVSPLVLVPMAGAEWLAAGSVSAFFEAGLSLYICEDGFLLAASYDGDSSSGSLRGERWFLEYPTVRFGLRWRP